jgi:predicted nucleic acid-binding protein
MNVISNTGPIIAFAKLDRLDILVSLFSTVLIPPMVHRELMGRIGEEWSAIEKGLQTFIEISVLKPSLSSMTKRAERRQSNWVFVLPELLVYSF